MTNRTPAEQAEYDKNHPDNKNLTPDQRAAQDKENARNA
jgi:hypothetical protein